MNKVILLGNIYRPALDQTIIVVTSEEWGKKGNKTSKQEFHYVVLDKEYPELKLGNKILVEGKIRTRKEKDERDKTLYFTEVVADTVSVYGN